MSEPACYSNGRLKRPVTSFESPPGKAGFRVSGLLLLGDFPPPFDQLHQHLAAIAQPMTFLQLVYKGDCLPRQIDDELMPPLGYEPAPVGAVPIALGIDAGSHRNSAKNIASNENL